MKGAQSKINIKVCSVYQHQHKNNWLPFERETFRNSIVNFATKNKKNSSRHDRKSGIKMTLNMNRNKSHSLLNKKSLLHEYQKLIIPIKKLKQFKFSGNQNKEQSKKSSLQYVLSKQNGSTLINNMARNQHQHDGKLNSEDKICNSNYMTVNPQKNMNDSVSAILLEQKTQQDKLRNALGECQDQCKKSQPMTLSLRTTCNKTQIQQAFQQNNNIPDQLFHSQSSNLHERARETQTVITGSRLSYISGDSEVVQFSKSFLRNGKQLINFRPQKIEQIFQQPTY